MTIEPAGVPHSSQRMATRKAYVAAVECVIERMRERLDAPLDLFEMAEAARVSPSHFDRVFRNITGVSPREFQTSLRLQHAARLLLTTSRSVTDVCLDVGYASVGSFTTRFTQSYGLSPMKLRELSEDLRVPWSTWLRHDIRTRLCENEGPPTVRGVVSVPDARFNGIVFIGLFHKPLPERLPVACCVVEAAGEFAIHSVTPGTYYLLGVAIPWCDLPMDFLLSELTLRGGVLDQPLVVDDTGRAHGRTSFALRSARRSDPPISLALPFMVVERLTGRGNARAKS